MGNHPGVRIPRQAPTDCWEKFQQYFFAKTLDIEYYVLYNADNEFRRKEICMMYAALFNKQNNLQKLWHKCNANGSFVMSVCANNSAETAE